MLLTTRLAKHLSAAARAATLSAALAVTAPAGFQPFTATADEVPPMVTAPQGPQHAIAMHGDPLYPEGFSHFAYANPRAPKRGSITFAATNSFDSLNPFIVKGTPALGLREHVFESLMARGQDEPFTLYGLLAETVEVAPDRSWVEFSLNPAAAFSDGTPVTVEDVVFSLETLREKGRPNHRYYYGKVTEIERPGDRTIRMIFDGGDREIPLIMGLMPILPKHFFEDREFEETFLDPPLGSGPYVVDQVQPGKRITYRRNPNYWGKDLAVNRGQHNFDIVRYDYYRDSNAAFEAFKAEEYDVRPELDPTRWATSYNFPAAIDGRVELARFKTGSPACMRGLVFNTRREIFADRNVRQALIQVFDFEWMNRNLFHGLYERTKSYFDNSYLSSFNRPASAAERALLEPYGDSVDPEILERGYFPPVSGGTGANRANRRVAMQLLRDAGWEISNGLMTNTETGEPLAFEIVLVDPEDERIVLNYARALEGIGVKARVRPVDASIFQQLKQTYDYDMVPNEWCNSLSPGNEQSFYWGSAGVATEGTRNYMGADDPAIDAMIEALLEATTREEFTAAVRALDRVLLSGYYVVPWFHVPEQWVAIWNHIEFPDRASLYGYQTSTWWRAAEN